MTLNIERKEDYTIYNVRFNDLTDLYYYLKSDPEVNSQIFETQASLENGRDFAGDSLDKATEYLVKGYDKGFENFLITSERMQHASIETTDTRKLERGLYGGIPLAPLVAAGVPDCMLRYERESKEVVRNMFFSLAYPHWTKTSSIVNRGLGTLYIIDALEKQGEIINFTARETSRCGDEIVNIEVGLKRPGDMMLDIKKCYYPMVGKEFLRRLLFRVLESVPVRNYWNGGYGSQLEETELRNIFKLKTTDLVVSTPGEIGIRGEDIYDDTTTLINNLNLNESFDINKIKKIGQLRR